MIRLRKTFIGTALIAVIVGASVYVASPAARDWVMSKWLDPRVLGGSAEIPKTAGKEVYSSPLRTTSTAPNAALTAEGVIVLTNAERTAVGGLALRQNDKLRQAAEMKLKDMFDAQYFEHISPDGRGPGYIASEAGYNYIVVGENLALGNFKDDAALVAAWMQSPGHRENILNARFSEIGVAVGRGMYEGKITWLAVQEFGQPASACPEVNANLKTRIDAQKAEITALDAKLSGLKEELNTLPQGTSAEKDAYNQKISEYNAMVAIYNKKLATLRANIDAYNAEVRAFNACIKTD